MYIQAGIYKYLEGGGSTAIFHTTISKVNSVIFITSDSPPPPPDESVIAGNPDYRGILPAMNYHRRFYCDWLEKTSLVDRYS